MTSRFVKKTELSSAKETSVLDSTEEFIHTKNDERGIAVIYNPKRHLPLRDQRKCLPIFSYYREFLWAIHVTRVLIVIGETGSGKSTQLPQYLKEAGWVSSEQTILVCVAMRITAISLATRVAEECDCVLGSDVGYIIAEEACITSDTRIQYITDGIMLQLIQADPLLLNVGVIIMDDCHQRRSESDIILALLKKIQLQRPYLRVIFCSATVDTEMFAMYFTTPLSEKIMGCFEKEYTELKSKQFQNRDISWKCQDKNDSRPHNVVLPETLLDVAILQISGRLYPVETYYLETPTHDYLKAAFQTILQIHTSTKDLDTILVFVCGKKDVGWLVEELLQSKESSPNKNLMNIEVCPLYGSLPIQQQLLAFRQPSRDHRKIIISTNIAESSVTIDHVGYVVDAGLVKLNYYCHEDNIDELCIVPISRASAEQRSGRAGRLRPGKCYRLYTEEYFLKKMHDFTLPEIMRSDISFLVLYLLSLGIDNFITKFDLPAPIPSDLLISALSKLFYLQAIDACGKLTDDYGAPMAELLPLDPMLSRLVIHSTKVTPQCSYEATIIASMVMCGNPWVVPNSKSKMKQQLLEACMRSIGVREGDLITLYNVYKESEFYRTEDSNWESRHMISSKALEKAQNIFKRLEKKLLTWGIQLVSVGDDVKSLQKMICGAFFMNAAYRQGEGKYLPFTAMKKQENNQTVRYLMLHPLSLTNPHQPPFVVYHHAIRTGDFEDDEEAQMIHVTPIELSWLEETASHYYKLHCGPSESNSYNYQNETTV